MLRLSFKHIIFFFSVLLLVGCSSEPKPEFTATGYIADYGVVRFWRLDNSDQQPQTLIRVYSPYVEGKYSIMTRIEFIDGYVSQITQRTESTPSVLEQLRFDQHGNVTFQQRQLSDSRQSLSTDNIAYLSYIATQSIEMTNTLIDGQVNLRQGSYLDGQLTTCEGKPLVLVLDNGQRDWLAKRTKTNRRLWLSWLEAPKGIQLLLASHQNQCIWQPRPENM